MTREETATRLNDDGVMSSGHGVVQGNARGEPQDFRQGYSRLDHGLNAI